MELAELGTGGGQGDLAQQHELDVADPALVGQLMALCATKLQGQTPLLTSVLSLLSTAMTDGTCSINLEDFDLLWKSDLDGDIDPDMRNISLEKLVPALAQCVTKSKVPRADAVTQGKRVARPTASTREDGLPTQIVSFLFIRLDHMLTVVLDFPVLAPLFIRRTVYAARSFQATGHLPVHS